MNVGVQTCPYTHRDFLSVGGSRCGKGTSGSEQNKGQSLNVGQ
jgi:hypothetical protein